MMKICIERSQFLLLLAWAVCTCYRRKFVASGFAYAPNFITKIIQEDTGITPPIETEGGSKASSAESIVQTLAPPVRTRFPPEPNGYLHLGHAKAISFNFEVARMFGGHCNMRMDDTNPSKEDKEYVESILEDVRWIQSGLYNGKDPWDGSVRKTSSYFDEIYASAEYLIEQGDAYVDSLSADEMREYRGTLTEPGKNSPFRDRSVKENLKLFREMRAGKFAEGEHVLRAKIDMSSPNINLRDPTLYRIKHESHQETGDAWCIYPMYDFSHPIADALEDITHSLCTLEFEDHRPFYDWTIEKLLPSGIISSRPRQIEFSRLNIQSTVLSKRKLIQLVEQGYVNGWDDPRLPTLSGMRRRGVPPAALRLFCERVGISKADSNIAFSALEDCVRLEMDDKCPRAFCVLQPLKVTITNWEGGIEDFNAPRHPKIPEMGDRVIPFGKEIFIERTDFFDLEGPEGEANGGKVPKGYKRLLPNDKVRLRFSYVIHCDEIIRDASTREPVELRCTYIPETRAGVTPDGMKHVQGIIHWVEVSTGVVCTINEYDRLFSTEEPGRDSGDYLQDLNPKSLTVLENVVVEPSVVQDILTRLDGIQKTVATEATNTYMSSLAYQFERSGYFALDQATIVKEKIVFNRVVTLRDNWGGRPSGDQENRSRGKAGRVQQNQPGSSSGDVVEDVRRVAFRAATILDVQSHPEADNLLVCVVDCGDVDDDGNSKPRKVVAGLAGKIPVEELLGKKTVVVTNLKPAKMRGVESHAMLLAASDRNESNEKVELLVVPQDVPNGELLCIEGKETSQPDSLMKSKGALKVFERVQAALAVNKLGEAIWKGNDKMTYRLTTSLGPVKTPTLKDVAIG